MIHQYIIAGHSYFILFIQDFKDPSLTAFSHKYGAQTLLKNHPSVDVNLINKGINNRLG